MTTPTPPEPDQPEESGAPSATPEPPPPPAGAEQAAPPPPPAASQAPPAPVTPVPPAYPAAAPPVAAASDIPRFPNGKPMLDEQGRPASPKSRLAAAILAWFLGVFGVHRFYVGKIGTGVLMILTLGGLGIWVLIDFVWILVGNFKDKQERVLSNW
jgi:hypothetical protein